MLFCGVLSCQNGTRCRDESVVVSFASSLVGF